uniref:SH3 domain-containing protein n=1 Tax=Parastrongyloides trichosuri TaxID=131310 RepID=A0A0N4ZJT8_PARTI
MIGMLFGAVKKGVSSVLGFFGLGEEKPTQPPPNQNIPLGGMSSGNTTNINSNSMSVGINTSNTLSSNNVNTMTNQGGSSNTTMIIIFAFIGVVLVVLIIIAIFKKSGTGQSRNSGNAGGNGEECSGSTSRFSIKRSKTRGVTRI